MLSANPRENCAVIKMKDDPTVQYVLYWERLLGKGQYGRVYEGYKLTSEGAEVHSPVAIKVFNFDSFAEVFVAQLISGAKQVNPEDPYLELYSKWKKNFRESSLIDDPAGRSLAHQLLQSAAPELKKHINRVYVPQFIRDAFLDNEAKIIGLIYPGKKGIAMDNEKFYMVMPLIPGKPLGDSKEKRHSEIGTLNLTERLDLLCQVIEELNQLHHFQDRNNNKAGTIIHQDLKPPNVLVSVTEDSNTEQRQVEAHLIDYGCSFYVDDNSGESDNLLFQSRFEGAPAYFPIESINGGRYGVKSDIYTLVYIIAFILCDKATPLKNKLRGDTSKDKANAKFCFDHLVNFDGICDESDLKEVFLAFINRMQDNNYQNRPNTNEVADFFKTLLALCRCEYKDQIKKSVEEKLMRMARGLSPQAVEVKVGSCLLGENSSGLFAQNPAPGKAQSERHLPDHERPPYAKLADRPHGATP